MKPKAAFSSVIVGVLVLWALTPFWVARCSKLTSQNCETGELSARDQRAAAGQYADMFGATNALFAGLAFICVAGALILQTQELRDSRLEAVEARRQAAIQLEIASMTARLAALPDVIHLTCADLFNNYGGWLGNRREHDLETASVERLREMIDKELMRQIEGFTARDEKNNIALFRRIIDDVERLIRYKKDAKVLYDAIAEAIERRGQ